jgi:hypothetical protein
MLPSPKVTISIRTSDTHNLIYMPEVRGRGEAGTSEAWQTPKEGSQITQTCYTLLPM